MLNQNEVEEIKRQIESTELVINEIVKKPVKIKPKAPFITSTLQQSASTRLGFNVKRTMRVAQKLYEGGLITYMRTCLLYTSPSPRDATLSRMPSSA